MRIDEIKKIGEELLEEYGALSNYVWDFEEGVPGITVDDYEVVHENLIKIYGHDGDGGYYTVYVNSIGEILDVDIKRKDQE